MTVWDKQSKTATAVNFREMAPASANATMFVGSGWSSTKGSKSFAVPGEVRGMYEAHARFGRLPWADVVAPAARLASDGFRVERVLAELLHSVKAEQSVPAYEPFWAVYAPNGVIPVEGDVLTNAQLGRTLRAIADHGADGFYGGAIADDLIADLQAAGGLITCNCCCVCIISR